MLSLHGVSPSSLSNKHPFIKRWKNAWLTLALCANASGELKIKLLLVYHSKNHEHSKRRKYKKEIWRYCGDPIAIFLLRGSTLSLDWPWKGISLRMVFTQSPPLPGQCSCSYQPTQPLFCSPCIFHQCFYVTKNTNLTLREFLKGHYNIVNCLKNINIAWEEETQKTQHGQSCGRTACLQKIILRYVCLRRRFYLLEIPWAWRLT